MKKKILIISVAIMLLVSMTLSIFSLVMVDKLYQEKLEEKKSFSNNLEVGGFENYGISLMADTITTPDGYPMQLITASITPADPDILLEWTVEWKENKSHTGENVGDYIQLDPKNRSCDVKCLKAFGSDTILLKAIAGPLKKVGTCTISFVGKAQNMNVDTTAYSKDGFYYVESGGNETFNVKLSNKFNSVKQSLSVDVKAIGDAYFCTHVSTYSSDQYSNAQLRPLQDFIDKWCKVTLSGNTITFEGKQIIQYYSGDCTTDDKGTTDMRDDVRTYTNSYLSSGGRQNQYPSEVEYNHSHKDNYHFVVTVTDSVSGLKQSFKVKVVPYITVTMQSSNLVF